ncbi:MAG: bifunctional isocitrate dehydrogenase kinase/phosphatase [Myxococcaceae bacterium]
MSKSKAGAAQVQSAVGAILRGFTSYLAEFRDVTRRARQRFEARDWRGAQQDAFDRLEVRGRVLGGVVQELSGELGAAVQDRRLWAKMKAAFSRLVASEPNRELSETFFNSVTRRVFTTVGVDPSIEFVASDFVLPQAGPSSPVTRTYPRGDSTAALLERLLRDYGFQAPFGDLEGEVRLAAGEIDGYLRRLEDARPLDAVDVLRAVFFRGKGAYLVGRMRRGKVTTPLIIALLHEEDGLHVDAVLLTGDDASIVFSFTRSYFHVDEDQPSAVVAFLKTVMPQKRSSDLYIALGHNKHGKTELYREIRQHLEESQDGFAPARGDRGLVMVVFTLPLLDVVFKVIRDFFPPPKTTSREEVIEKYQHVFRHDRAGRLIDAQEFEQLAFDRTRFDPELLDELLRECGRTFQVAGDQVRIKHLYVERRLTPLNLYLREADEVSGRRAVVDYGQCIRDLAATNTFPGDLLLKNFGLTRTGRVIFYDYDELCRVTECRFRELPHAASDEEEMSGEPWFFVDENDIFPEEFLPFLGLAPPLKEAFLAAHAEILTPKFWRQMQERHRAGEIVDIFPYRHDRRLRSRVSG